MVVFEDINKKVYENLEQILQKLDDRLDLKLYAIIFNENQDWVETVRVKSVLIDKPDQETEIIQEELSGPEEVFKKLGLSQDERDTDLKQFLTNLETTNFKSNLRPIGKLSESNVVENQVVMEINEVLPTKQLLNEWNIFYSNRFVLEVKEELFTIQYILSIEYADSVTRYIFHEKPQLSFLRMILDYYFKDYYDDLGDHTLFINEDMDIEIKYKENSIQFLQRLARLFFGRIQDLIINGTSLSDVSGADTDLAQSVRNQYYVNNLLEKIDGISTRTYEGESPFGCMLLIKSSMLEEDKLVNYSIRFQNNQPIYLEDARRIRKLLELTNNEKDLYLIADDKAIYGVGEIDWSQIKDNLVFKVEFKGLSRYDLLLVTTEEKKNTDARVVTDDELKIFKMTMNLEIVSHKLTSISFKHPGIGDGGFTPELFKRTMETQFEKSGQPITDKEIEKLRLVIQKATEQQSGTMVVITDRDTAEIELKKLRKQSTPIIPTEISPAFIKHLTSIDGAIYFDTTGACHAIGVILDGLAQEHLGDSSRGARFHSAYRYLEKLKIDKKGCVIAIISEDGMANLIPEQVNEAIVRQLVREMISYIKDNDTLSEEAIQDYERRLEEAAGETVIDHHHFFILAETFSAKSLYLQAARFYKRGLDVNGHFILKYNRALALSFLKHSWKLRDADEKLQSFRDALEQFEILIKTAANSELNYDDYNCRALALHGVGRLSDKKTKMIYFDKSLVDYAKAIEMRKGRKFVLYRNRGNLYRSMDKWQEAIDDYIISEMELSEEQTLNLIERLIKQEVPLFLHALASYSEKKNNKSDSENLQKLLAEYGAQLAVDYPEVAAALEQYGIDHQQPEDE